MQVCVPNLSLPFCEPSWLTGYILGSSDFAFK